MTSQAIFTFHVDDLVNSTAQLHFCKKKTQIRELPIRENLSFSEEKNVRWL